MRAAVSGVVLAAILLVACGDSDSGGAGAATESCASAAACVAITDAVIGEPAGPNAALYFTVQNDGEATGIVAMRTDAVETTSLHGHVNEGGQMVMGAIDGPLPLPSGPTVLEPGGLHVMLMGTGVDDLTAGDVVQFTVELTDGSTVEGEAAVIPLTDLVADQEAGEGSSDSTDAGGHGHDTGE